MPDQNEKYGPPNHFGPPSNASDPFFVSTPATEKWDSKTTREVMLADLFKKLDALENDKTVSHPAYYKTGKYEVIDVVEDWNLNFHLGNAVKYIARAGKKDPKTRLQDLKKALWYLSREIERDIA